MSKDKLKKIRQVIQKGIRGSYEKQEKLFKKNPDIFKFVKTLVK